MTNYADFVASVESPTGEDNRMGSGAFSKYQFMPATAAGLAQRTTWGRGLTPANIKAAVMADPSRADELFRLYNADSSSALTRAGLPANNTSMLALHRFGQGGGTSLLQAPANMAVAEWVKSVNWGPGVAADAVIRQNKLDRYANVGDLRRDFLGSNEAAMPTIADAVASPNVGTPPLAPAQAAPFQAPPQNQALIASLLADAFTPTEDEERETRRKPRGRQLLG